MKPVWEGGGGPWARDGGACEGEGAGGRRAWLELRHWRGRGRGGEAVLARKLLVWRSRAAAACSPK